MSKNSSKSATMDENGEYTMGDIVKLLNVNKMEFNQQLQQITDSIQLVTNDVKDLKKGFEDMKKDLTKVDNRCTKLEDRIMIVEGDTHDNGVAITDL